MRAAALEDLMAVKMDLDCCAESFVNGLETMKAIAPFLSNQPRQCVNSGQAIT
jgi:hypothetical protein